MSPAMKTPNMCSTPPVGPLLKAGQSMASGSAMPIDQWNRTGGRTLLVRVLIAAMVTLGGCGKEEPSPLSNSSSSVEATINRALHEIKEGDDYGLHELLITRYEHDSIIAPFMKDSTRLETFDFDLAWRMLVLNRTKGVRRAIEDFAGDSLTLMYVTFEAEPEVYGELTLRQRTMATIRDELTGQEFTTTIFGSIVEIGGRFKLISIRD